MDIWHPRWFWAFEQDDRPMRTSRECRGLREQPSIYDGGREVSIRLPFDDDPAVDEIVADGEMHQLDVEVFALSRQTEDCGVSF
jgi:hypothetical protein